MTVAQRDRAFRSLKGLERTGATSRVLNFSAISARHTEQGDAPLPPFFTTRVLGGAVIIRHRLRPEEHAVFSRPRYTATKVVVPFERTDLSLGGRSLFVGQPGWTKMLGGLHGETTAHPQDVAVLEALDELPSLDPFLVREQLKRRNFPAAAAHFALSPADLERMQGFVHDELHDLVRLACGAARVHNETERLAHAILSGEEDVRLEALRGALHLEDAPYGEGLFCWRGLLYYKWSMQEILPTLEAMVGDFGDLRLVGPRSHAMIERIVDLKSQVANGIGRRLSDVSGHLSDYDDAYALLRDQADPAGFRDFLLQAPQVFRAVGEDLGVLSHMASYWRYRFPANGLLLATPDELADILEEYALSLT